ncbi:MAG: hypothetical protein ABL995_05720 [Bryobacteraceae bacterium]
MNGDRISGALAIERDANRDLYALSYIPADFGRGGAMARVNLNREQLEAFFEEIQIREPFKRQALHELDTTNGCHLNDLAVSRDILRRMRLVD